MTIYKENGTTLAEIEVDDNSYRVRTLMGEHQVILYFSTVSHLEIPVGAYIQLDPTHKYILLKPSNIKVIHTHRYEYTVTFEAQENLLKHWVHINYVDLRVSWQLTAKPSEHLQYLIEDLNRRTAKTGLTWVAGDCVDDSEKLISYESMTCWEALEQMAETFGTEFSISGTTIHLDKVGSSDNPIAMSYGKGNGFKTGIGRSNSSDSTAIEYMYVQGGETNMNPNSTIYPHKTLQLPPVGTTLKYDGEHFEGETGYDASKAYEYEVVDGARIRNKDLTSTSRGYEASIDLSDIYPQRTGKVTSVVVVDSDKHWYDIIDESTEDPIPNYNNYQIAGETMTLIFQTGNLAGREFGISKYDHTKKRFSLSPIEEDGMTFPSTGGYEPAVGNKYVVFGCELPLTYIINNLQKTGASYELFKGAIKELYEQETDQFSLTAEVDPIWIYARRMTVLPLIVIGNYIAFTDTGFQTSAVNMRITQIKDNINKPYEISLTFSNYTKHRSRIRKALGDVSQKNGWTIDKFSKFNGSLSRKSSSLSSGISDLNITLNNGVVNNNVSIIKTLLSSEATQVRFVQSLNDGTVVSDTIAYNATTKAVTVGSSYIETNAIASRKTLTSSPTVNRYAIPSFSGTLADTDTPYYLYAQVSTNGGSNRFITSETLYDYDSVANYYTFLLAYLNPEISRDRVISRLYGYTDISTTRISVDKIQSASGNSKFDLVNDTFNLGQKLDFSSGALTMKDASLTTPTLTTPTITNPSITGGTLTNPTLTSPTLTNPTLTSPTITGGTMTNATLTTTTLNSPTINTPSISGGSLTNPTLSNPTITTPSITGGTIASPTITTPTITSPTISNGTISTPTLTKPTMTSQISKTRAMDSAGEIPSDELVIVNTAQSSNTLVLPRSPEAGATYKIISQSASETTLSSANSDILANGQQVQSVSIVPYGYAEAIYVRGLGWCVLKNS